MLCRTLAYPAVNSYIGNVMLKYPLRVLYLTVLRRRLNTCPQLKSAEYR